MGTTASHPACSLSISYETGNSIELCAIIPYLNFATTFCIVHNAKRTAKRTNPTKRCVAFFSSRSTNDKQTWPTPGSQILLPAKRHTAIILCETRSQNTGTQGSMDASLHARVLRRVACASVGCASSRVCHRARVACNAWSTQNVPWARTIAPGSRHAGGSRQRSHKGAPKRATHLSSATAEKAGAWGCATGMELYRVGLVCGVWSYATRNTSGHEECCPKNQIATSTPATRGEERKKGDRTKANNQVRGHAERRCHRAYTNS